MKEFSRHYLLRLGIDVRENMTEEEVAEHALAVRILSYTKLFGYLVFFSAAVKYLFS